MYKHQVYVIGLNIGVLMQSAPQIFGGVMGEMSGLISAGVLGPGSHTVYPLADGPKALAELEARATVGKLALVPRPPNLMTHPSRPDRASSGHSPSGDPPRATLPRPPGRGGLWPTSSEDDVELVHGQVVENDSAGPCAAGASPWCACVDVPHAIVARLAPCTWARTSKSLTSESRQLTVAGEIHELLMM